MIVNMEILYLQLYLAYADNINKLKRKTCIMGLVLVFQQHHVL